MEGLRRARERPPAPARPRPVPLAPGGEVPRRPSGGRLYWRDSSRCSDLQRRYDRGERRPHRVDAQPRGADPQLPARRDRRRGDPRRGGRRSRCCGPTSRRTPTRRSGRRGWRSCSATTSWRRDLRGWINEGLMTLFFLVVGLEAKRELDLGELRERTRLAIPVVASLGGMVTAAAIYLAINAGGDGAGRLGRGRLDRHGAGARRARAAHARARDPPARVPAHRRRHRRPRGAAGDRARLHARTSRWSRWRWRSGSSACSWRCAGPGSWRGPAAVLVGVGIWLAMFESGVDAVIAGLAIGLITSAYPPERDAARAQHRAHALVPRAADAGAGLLGAREPRRRRSRPTSACSTACIRGRAA